MLLDSGSVAFNVVDVHCPACLAEMRLVFNVVGVCVLQVLLK